MNIYKYTFPSKILNSFFSATCKATNNQKKMKASASASASSSWLTFPFIGTPHICDHSLVRNQMMSEILCLRQQLDLICRVGGKRQHPADEASAAAPQQAPPKRRKLSDMRKSVKKMAASQINSIVEKLFAGLRTISDIVKLPQHKDMDALMDNAKYAKFCNAAASLAKLDDMVGLDSVKQKVFDLVCYFATVEPAPSMDCMHMMIYGPPGTGKTQLGKVLAAVFLDLGILEKETFVIGTRSNMVGQYLGATAIRTQKLIDSAMGGCLFIDEVYSLGDANQRDAFSKEAIDCLNLNLTEKKGKFLCIVAGYRDQIESAFLSTNPGLDRRFPIRFDLSAGYTPSQLQQIFTQKLEQSGWTVEEKQISPISGLFSANKFVNYAGDIETLVSLSKIKSARRQICNAKTVCSLQSKDVDAAFREHFAPKPKEQNLSMYL